MSDERTFKKGEFIRLQRSDISPSAKQGLGVDYHVELDSMENLAGMQEGLVVLIARAGGIKGTRVDELVFYDDYGRMRREGFGTVTISQGAYGDKPKIVGPYPVKVTKPQL